MGDPGRERTEEVQHRQRVLKEQLQEFVDAKDYLAAADIQNKLEALEKGNAASRGENGNAASLGANGPVGEPTSISELYDPARVMYVKVNLQNVRLLSIGKVSQAPMPKGKGKSKGNAKGVPKSAQPQRGSTSKAMSVPGTQPVVPVYFGQDGYTICTLAYGDEVVKRVPHDMALGSLVDVHLLRPRPGQLGVLYWNEDTIVKRRLEEVDCGSLHGFPYVTNMSKDFCTLAYAQDLAVGEHVALVLRAIMVEQKWNQRGEVYLEAHGLDLENATVNYLRLWRFAETDLQAGRTTIIRGLKVVLETQWDGSKYVPRLDGPKIFECTNRATIEDVSHVPAITSLFS